MNSEGAGPTSLTLSRERRCGARRLLRRVGQHPTPSRRTQHFSRVVPQLEAHSDAAGSPALHPGRTDTGCDLSGVHANDADAVAVEAEA